MKTKILLIAFAACFLNFGLKSQSGGFDPSFDMDGIRADNFGRAGNFVNTSTLQPDGKILLAGEISSDDYPNFAITRLMPDGSPDPGFGQDGLAQIIFGSQYSAAMSIALLPDGRILVGGISQEFDGDYSFAVARLLPDGSLDPVFGMSGKFLVNLATDRADILQDIYLLPSGKFAVSGFSRDVSTNECRAVVCQFSADGQPDPGFGVSGVAQSPPFYPKQGLAPQTGRAADGRFIVCKVIETSFSNSEFQVSALLADGQPDGAFGEVGFDPTSDIESVFDLKVLPDGKILFCGAQLNVYDVMFCRLMPDGQPDTDFNGGGFRTIPKNGFEIAYSVGAQADGRVLLVGTSFGGPNDGTFVIQLNADGSDNAFATTDYGTPPGNGSLNATTFLLQPDGKTLIAGSAKGEVGAARFMPDFTPDPGFGTGGAVHFSTAGGDDFPRAIALQPDGKILVGGDSHNFTGKAMSVARYLPDGQFDSGFGTMGRVLVPFDYSNYGSVFHGGSLALQTDGKILVAGTVKGQGATQLTRQFGIARLLADGNLDLDFGPSGSGTVTKSMGTGDENSFCNAIALISGGRIMAAGSVSAGPTLAQSGCSLMRFLPDGSLDNSFGSMGKMVESFNGAVSSGAFTRLETLPDGRLLAIGDGDPALNFDQEILIARYLPDGSPDPSFSSDGLEIVNAPIGQYALASAMYPDGRFLVGGFNLGGTPFKVSLFVRRFLADGTADNSFGSGGVIQFGGAAPDYQVADALAIQADSKILIAGYAAGGAVLIRLLPFGQLDTDFGTGGYLQLNTDGESGAIALQPDGRVLVAGGSYGQHDSDAFVARVLPGQVIATAEQNAPALALSASPNPATALTFLEFYLNENTPVAAFIADAQGRVVRDVFSKKEITAGSHRIETDLRGLPAGIYWLVVETDGRPAAVRVVKN